MKISKRSVHYRFLDKVSSYTPPRDFCRYMRNLVGWILIYGVLAVTIPSVIAGMVLDLGALIFGLESIGDFLRFIFTDIGFIGQTFVGVIMSLGVIAWLIAGVCLTCLIVDKIKARRRMRANSRYKQTSLIAEWWKAHREKVCPIIEFTE